MEKFGGILFIHIFIIVPIIYIWSKNRNWETFESKNIKTWKQPLIILQVSIAVIYPLLWGIYFNILKILRLNKTLDLSLLFSIINYDICISLFFMWPFFSVWLKFFIWKFLDFRNILWFELKKIILTFHIFFLKYTIYFKIMEKLWKLSFLFLSYVNLDAIVYPIPNNFQKIISRFYKSSFLLTFLIVIIIIFEFFFFKGKIFYSLYILLILAIIKPIIYFLSNFNGIGNNGLNVVVCRIIKIYNGINLVTRFFFGFTLKKYEKKLIPRLY
jgi:hypothetical protein